MTPSQRIDQKIAELPDWRGEVLTSVRQLVLEADPDLVEDWKWNTAVWTHNGNICSMAAFLDHVKITFFKGALLEDVQGLFNAELDAKQSRSIDLRKDSQLNSSAFQDLVQAAAAHS